MPTLAPQLIDLEALIDTAAGVEPLPHAVLRLSRALADPDSDVQDLVAIVSLDPALAARVLRTANSAGIGGRGSIGSLKEAVVRVGRGMLMGIAVAGHVRATAEAAVPVYGLQRGELWEHSVRVAVATDLVAQRSRIVRMRPAFTAGLLHDIGKITLARFLDLDALGFIQAAIRAGRRREDAERDLLGTDHAEIGALVARAWGLPEDLAIAIQYHHTPDAVDSPLADAIELGNCIAHLGLHEPAHPHAPSLDRLEIPAAELPLLAQRAVDRYDRLAATL